MKRRIRSRYGVGLPLALAVACGGGSAPRQSTPAAPTNPGPIPPSGWSVTGQLVDTSARQPVSGAEIAPTWDLASVTTTADGTFELRSTTNPPTTPYRLRISGSDLISRELWVLWQRGARTDVTLDAIRNRPPFVLEFYRQFVRGTHDYETVYPLYRWMNSPSFYIKTVDQNGKAVEESVLAIVRGAIHRAVAQFTAGKLSVVALESGTEPRPQAAGWINVDIVRDRRETRCGWATVGADPGNITFVYDRCACGSNKIPGSLVFHEVGHALGFFHVADTRSVMYPTHPNKCPRGELSAAEKYHAAIAYSRPRGNTDPDVDPSSAHSLAAMPIVIADH